MAIERTAGVAGATSALCAALGAAVAAGAVPASGDPLVLYVDDDAPAGGDGRSWEGAFEDLQDALALACRQGCCGSVEIRVAQGEYRPDRGTGDANMSFQVGSGVTVALMGGFAGLGAADPDASDPSTFTTVLSADLRGDDLPGFVNREDNSRHVARVRWPGGVIDGFTIRGGAAIEAGGCGGGIACGAFAYLTLQRCVLEGNLADLNGGAVCAANTMRIDACEFRGNRAARGSGGGVFCTDSSISHSVFDGNSAGRDGGGLCVQDSDASGEVLGVSSSTFMRNVAGLNGGGIWTDMGYAVVDGSLLAGNTAGENGGGAAVESMNCWIQGTTIAENTAGASGGGVYFRSYGNAEVVYSILWGDAAADEASGHEIAVASPFGIPPSVSVDLSDVQFGRQGVTGETTHLNWSDSSLDADPMFSGEGDAGADRFRLTTGSPCIDRLPYEQYRDSTLDLSGGYRQLDGNRDCIASVDLGAFEFVDPVALVRPARFISRWTPVAPWGHGYQVVDLTGEGEVLLGRYGPGRLDHVLWDGQRMEQLNFPVEFVPTAMNSRGEIAGVIRGSGAPSAALLTGGVLHDFRDEIGPLASAWVVLSDSGDLAGLVPGGMFVRASGGESGGGGVTIVPMGAGSVSFGAINSEPAVVGTRVLPGGSTSEAFVWRDGVLSVLPTLGGEWTSASDINERGEIVGSSSIPGLNSHAVRWRPDGSVEDLGAHECGTGATAVNGAGQTVGTACRPVLFEGAGFAFLDLLAARPAGTLFNWADAINDRGQIAGLGSLAADGSSTAFLLTVRCPADWNADGIGDSQDYFSFVEDFFAGRADANGDCACDGSDMLSYIADFSAGCG